MQDRQNYENIFVIISLRNTQENVENVTNNAILDIGLLNTGPQDFFFLIFSLLRPLLSDLNSLCERKRFMYIATISCSATNKRTTIASCDNRDTAFHSLYGFYVRDFYLSADLMDAADELLLVEEPTFRKAACSPEGYSLPSWNRDGTRIYRVQEVTTC